LAALPPGLARLGFEAADGRTRLAQLEPRTPLRVLFPRVPAGEALEAVLINTGGGVVGGDGSRSRWRQGPARGSG